MQKITVLIVDDSALIRTLFTQMLNAEKDIEVVGTAVDPLDAREKIKQLNPQVVTLDIEMPKMDGLSFLEKIMTLRPMPVIMASTLTLKGADATIRALELGAVDYISKPSNTHLHDAFGQLKKELVTKVRAAAIARIAPRLRSQSGEAAPLPFNPKPGQGPRMIAIGSSTGGVEALRDVFQQLPANCPPIMVVQHMPEQFTPSFAARLNSLSQVEVCEARNGMTLETGHAYLAPGNRHMKIVKSGNYWKCQVEPGPAVSGHRPSVDVLFQSVAEVVGSDAVGVILTGMGKDGAVGLLRMREAGAYTIGQSQNSCVVYGMPRAAQMIGAVQIELPLSEIPAHMLSHLSQEKGKHHAG